MEAEVKWHRSTEGFCKSKCGRLEIRPQWCGRVNPVFFALYDNHAKRYITRTAFTQREAKQASAAK